MYPGQDGLYSGGTQGRLVLKKVSAHGSVEICPRFLVPLPGKEVQRHLPVEPHGKQRFGELHSRHNFAKPAAHPSECTLSHKRKRTWSSGVNARAKADTRMSQPFRNSHLNADMNLNDVSVTSGQALRQKRKQQQFTRA